MASLTVPWRCKAQTTLNDSRLATGLGDSTLQSSEKADQFDASHYIAPHNFWLDYLCIAM
jgi:hypothetical protein